jgi:hypothetical protein
VNSLARRAVGTLLPLAAAGAAMVAMSGTAQAAEVVCPNTFHVLHNDRIGKLKLPEGHYTITVLNDEKLSCEKAASKFARFLQDYDGNLPGKWKVIVAEKEFRRGNSDVGFRVAKGSHSGGGGGRHPSGSGKRCAGTFRVLHNDRIGRLRLPAGKYKITRLSKRSPTCARAEKLFARFLQHPDGVLPNRWELRAGTATFTRRGTNRGFRVKPA